MDLGNPFFTIPLIHLQLQGAFYNRTQTPMMFWTISCPIQNFGYSSNSYKDLDFYYLPRYIVTSDLLELELENYSKNFGTSWNSPALLTWVVSAWKTSSPLFSAKVTKMRFRGKNFHKTWFFSVKQIVPPFQLTPWIGHGSRQIDGEMRRHLPPIYQL